MFGLSRETSRKPSATLEVDAPLERVRVAGRRLAELGAAMRAAFTECEAALRAAPGMRWAASGQPDDLLERARMFVGAPSEAESRYLASCRAATRGGEPDAHNERLFVSERLRHPVVPPPTLGSGLVRERGAR